jgi:hypothetical protein
MNVRTQHSRFEYKNAVVDGTFITEVYINARTDNNRRVLYSQSSLRANANNWGWKMSNGTCNEKSFYTIPHNTRYCDNFEAQTEMSSTVLSFNKWKITVTTGSVFNHISGVYKRLDIRISGPENTISHGIIGQSYNSHYVVKTGNMDVYPTNGTFTTRAQAEGSIEGTHHMYEMKTPYATEFAFSVFDRNLTEDETGDIFDSTIDRLDFLYES